MTFIEKVKESVELTTGCRFYYHAAGELNEVLSGVEIGEEPIAFAYLLKGGEVAVGKNCREGVNLAVFFCKKTEFDFNSYENEQLIDECKQIAFAWVSWFSKSNTLEIVGNVTTERVYDTTTDILTGIAVNITLRELVGYGMCDIKKPVLIIEKNGVYTLGAYDVKVDVLPKTVDLLAKDNGTYLPSEYCADAFGKVDVDVPQLGWKMVFSDGTECRIYAKRLWNINFFYGNSYLVEIDTSTYNIDTSGVYDMDSLLSNIQMLKRVDLSGLDTSNVTSMEKFLLGCPALESVDLSVLDTSKVINMDYFLDGSYSLKSVNLSNFNTSNAITICAFLRDARSLKSVDLTSFNTSKVINISEIFRNCYELRTADLTSFDVSQLSYYKPNMCFSKCNELRSIIGEHTLEDVENGLTTLSGLRVSISINDSGYLRYSSMLAMLNSFADMTGENAQTLTFHNTAWNNMSNDDDTIPDADTIAKRQARLSAIAAQKNWTIVY